MNRCSNLIRNLVRQGGNPLPAAQKKTRAATSGPGTRANMARAAAGGLIAQAPVAPAGVVRGRRPAVVPLPPPHSYSDGKRDADREGSQRHERSAGSMTAGSLDARGVQPRLGRSTPWPYGTGGTSCRPGEGVGAGSRAGGFDGCTGGGAADVEPAGAGTVVTVA